MCNRVFDNRPRSGVAAGSPILAQNFHGYDGFDNRQFEQQAVRGPTSANSPQINYDWTFASAYNGGGNFNRLDKMTYPRRLNGMLRRQIDLQYGDAGGPNAALDEALHRVAKIQDLTSGGSASYAYAGSSRRVSLMLGAALLAQSFVGGTGLAGLDAFGRTRDLDYISSPGVPVDPPIPASARSANYVYDGLQRLIAADLGVLDAGGAGVPAEMSSPTRSVD